MDNPILGAIVFDEHGYPTDESLDTFTDRVEAIVAEKNCFQWTMEEMKRCWHFEEYMAKHPESDAWFVSTAGWSGNEAIVEALPPVFRALYQYAYRAGGHYVFAPHNWPWRIDFALKRRGEA